MTLCWKVAINSYAVLVSSYFKTFCNLMHSFAAFAIRVMNLRKIDNAYQKKRKGKKNCKKIVKKSKAI